MTFLLYTWLQGLSRKAARGARARRGAKRNRQHRVVLRLEALEDRMVPSQNGYIQTNLVSDLASQNAQIIDPNLKNPWGISESATGPFSISDQKTHVSTQYAVTAAGVSQVPGTIAIPTTAVGPQGPTGQVFNDTSSFLVNGTPATTIFASLNGTISAWNSSTGTTAQVVVTTNGAAVYSGLDMGSNALGDFLFAANPKQGRIDVYNDSFVLQKLGTNAFVDPSLPAGLVPFNVDNINGVLYVMYAPAGPPTARTSALEGHGAVAAFDTSGNFIRQVTSGGKLASPWGITLAPATFGEFGGDLLVGNFSYQAGEINAFDPVSGAYRGTLADENDNTLLAGSQGLWYLTFGNGGNGGLADTLYFTAGLNAETDGLFGAIIPTLENGNSQGSNGQGNGLRASPTDGNVSPSAFVGIQPIGLLGGNDLGTGAFNSGPGLIRVAPVDPFAGVTADHVADQPGVNYPGTQVEPTVVANPTRANNLVGAWQQDRWSNGGARGIVIGVSNDAGHHWDSVVLPGVSLASGGKYARATDPWLAFAPNGDLYATTLAKNPAQPNDPFRQYPFDETGSAMLISKSTDGGQHWGAPTTLIENPNPGPNAAGHPALLLNDKETVTVDPHNSNFVYVTWTRIDYDLAIGDFRGPTYFTRSTDGGQTWEAARPIYDPGSFASTIGNQIVVLPNGNLVDVFAEGSEADKNGNVAVIRSTDHGQTWSAKSIILTGAVVALTDPETGIPIRSGEVLPEIASDSHTGAVYVVTQAIDLKNGPQLHGIIFSGSNDGGLTWSSPITINQTPTGLPEANRQAFDPSIKVADNGTVAVTYYDLRNNTPAAGLPTDLWAVFANPRDPHNAAGGLGNPANWGHEVRLTNHSFDQELAPQSTNENGGYFLGDYQALTVSGNRFLAFFSIAGTDGDATAGVYARWFGPAGRASQETNTDLPYIGPDRGGMSRVDDFEGGGMISRKASDESPDDTDWFDPV